MTPAACPGTWLRRFARGPSKPPLGRQTSWRPCPCPSVRSTTSAFQEPSTLLLRGAGGQAGSPGCTCCQHGGPGEGHPPALRPAGMHRRGPRRAPSSRTRSLPAKAEARAATARTAEMPLLQGCRHLAAGALSGARVGAGAGGRSGPGGRGARAPPPGRRLHSRLAASLAPLLPSQDRALQGLPRGVPTEALLGLRACAR